MKTLLYILALFFVSCKSVHLSSRASKDLQLFQNDTRLNQTFNNDEDPNKSFAQTTIWQRLSNKKYKTEYLQNTSVELKVLDQYTVQAKLMSGSNVLEEKLLKGKFKKGYFSLKNRFDAGFTVGPLLWAFAGFKIHLGLTKENNLVFLESNAGSTVILFLPIFWAGSENAYEYQHK